MILVIDNYDSFTYNIVQYLGELGAVVRTVRNDAFKLDDIDRWAPSHILLSPGPCTPNEAGISLQVIERFAGEIPLLGVCLGHQCIGQAFGGQVIRAKTIMHGKTSLVHHLGEGVFAKINNPYTATRYHSLVLDQARLPDCLQVTAWTVDDAGEREEIMGIAHKQWPVYGVQFHPESILTEYGHQLLKNFMETRL